MKQRAVSRQRSAISMPRLVASAALLLGWSASFVHGQDARQKLLERVFGDAVRLDPAMVAKVKAAKPGEQFFVDRNDDGKNDECWYIDTSPRHTDAARPLLVRAIDEDGDLDAWKGPDLDSDLYVADWKADGVVDVVLDYQDNDGDHDVDEMGMYFFVPEHRYFGRNVLMVWWGRDDGDDNLLWYDVNYTYDQRLCQYRCHFSGDETFVSFGLRADDEQWTAAYECPFLFWDPDNDLCSEVVLRLEVLNGGIRSARYSFDADDDAYGRRTHDYDFSITAVADDDKPLLLPPELAESTKLRGIPTQGWLKRDKARAFVENASWSRVLLTWDEINANTEQDASRDPNERWEGVIAHGNDRFPQAGGPPCSIFNKRNELSLKPVTPMRLYYDPTDRRLHLMGADDGWIHIDYDFDGTADAKYTYLDDDGDGVFDRRRLDLDADGRIDFDWKTRNARVRAVGPDFATIASLVKPAIAESLADSQAFIDEVKRFHAVSSGEQPVDPVETFFRTKLDAWRADTHLGEYVRKSPAGVRFFVDLVRDRLFKLLKDRTGATESWAPVESTYSAGDYDTAADLLGKKTTLIASPSAPKPVRSPSVVSSFSRRLPIHIDGIGVRRVNWPVTLAVERLRDVGGDFNPENCAIVSPERWLDWRQIPHQVDEIDPATEKELSFLADIVADAPTTYYLYYSPTGKGDRVFPRRTDTAEDWVPPNIGWESNLGAYRAYWGQFDFFGKKTEQLVYDNIEKKSYHGEVEWGIDALHVNKTSGLGGLTLYVGDEAYPVQNPAGEGKVEFTKRQVCKGPIRAVCEIVARNIVPGKPDLTVRMQCMSYAERQESEIRVKVTGASRSIMLAPGLVKLTREQTFAEPKKGFIGSWGWQEEVIGDIGMAVIAQAARVVDVIDLPEERRMRCRLDENGELRYWIIGDWRRGRRHPVAPTVRNWEKEVQALADSLVDNMQINVGSVEDVK